MARLDMPRPRLAPRIGFISLSLLLVTVFLSWCPACSARAADSKSNDRRGPPHIVFLLADDLGWNDAPFRTSGEASGGLHLPHIGALATRGVILDNYYVQPLCSPSRTSLMSGRYPYRNGLAHGVIVNGYPAALNHSLKTLPELLRERHGYKTAMLGKWDCGMTRWENTPIFRGFDSFVGYLGAAEDYFRHNWTTHAPDGKALAGGFDFRRNAAPLRAGGEYSMDLYTREAVRIIESHDAAAAPLLLYFASQAVHWPLEAKKDDLVRCRNVSGGAQRQVFCGMLVALDDAVGAIHSALEKRGMLEDTLFVFSTDNGGQQRAGGNNWPLRGGKFTVFEGGIRGAAFVAGAGVDDLAGSHYTGLMHITDWLPTLVDGVAGAHRARQPLAPRTEAAELIDGKNVWESLASGGKIPSPRTEVLHQYDPPFSERDGQSFIGQAALRMGDFKLIELQPNCSMTIPESPRASACASGWVPLEPTPAIPPPANPSLLWLFDVKNDPLEKHNLAASHPDVVAKLRARLKEFTSLAIRQQLPAPFAEEADPARHGGFWTPWE